MTVRPVRSKRGFITVPRHRRGNATQCAALAPRGQRGQTAKDGRLTMLARQWTQAVVAAAAILLATASLAFAQGNDVLQATLGETGAKTAEVSTAELRRILADGSAVVLDSRKRAEYVAGHIAGAKNLN